MSDTDALRLLQPNVESSAVSLPTGTAESSTLFGRVRDSLQGNPLFNAGAGLAGLGLAMGVLRRFSQIGNTILRRRFLISLQLNNEDPAYPWLLDFINRHSQRAARSLSGHTTVRVAESGRSTVALAALPGHGMHFFTYNYRWIKCERQREEQTVQIDGRRTPFETVTLTTLGTEPRFLLDMVEAAASEALGKIETGMVMYKAVGPEWKRSGEPRPKRDKSSVVLEGNTAQRLIDDVTEFVGSRKWYAERGIPYRRGYLFYGPPGTGKSSFITCLASHFGYSVCTMTLSDRLLDDDRLGYLLNTPPPNSIIILEDIDAATTNREDPQNAAQQYQGMTRSRVTMSGLLNAIDGIGCAEERILFMTTNHAERLDPALIRPGRVDVRQYFGNATREMMEQMFIRFYGLETCTRDQAAKFADNAWSVSEESHVPISPAALQGHFLFHKDNPAAAIATVGDICRKLKNDVW